jgi:hypothetical protein
MLFMLFTTLWDWLFETKYDHSNPLTQERYHITSADKESMEKLKQKFLEAGCHVLDMKCEDETCSKFKVTGHKDCIEKIMRNETFEYMYFLYNPIVVQGSRF